MKKIIIITKNEFWLWPIFKVFILKMKNHFSVEEVEIKVVNFDEKKPQSFVDLVKIFDENKSKENIIFVEYFSNKELSRNILNFIDENKSQIILFLLQEGKLYEVESVFENSISYKILHL